MQCRGAGLGLDRTSCSNCFHHAPTSAAVLTTSMSIHRLDARRAANLCRDECAYTRTGYRAGARPCESLRGL
eukprot:6086070-Pyramimonas_sp.AAC.1